jgi:ketopantoate reductase
MHREASQEEGKAMKVVMLGAGALGSLIGAHLARAGEGILFIVHSKHARSREGHMHVRDTRVGEYVRYDLRVPALEEADMFGIQDILTHPEGFSPSSP